MKKTLYFAAALLVLSTLSCNKKEVLPIEENNFTPLVIKAVVDEDLTKTTYTLNGAETAYEFAWNANDYVAVQVYKGGNSSTPDQIKFQASSNGPTTTLRQVLNGSNDFDLTTEHNVGGTYTKTGYTLGDYAFYPKYEPSNNNDLLYVRNATNSGDGDSSTDYLKLYESVPYVSENPSSVIPIIGKKDSGNGTPDAVYTFKTATGVLKISLKNIPAGSTSLVLTSKSASDKLSGEWLFTDDTYSDGIKMDTGNKNYTNKKIITFSGLSGLDSYTDFYVPIPVGAINGLLIDVKKDDNTLLWRVSTDQVLTITRGIVTELPAIDMSGKSIAFTVGKTSSDPTVSFTKSGVTRVCVNVTNTADNFPSGYPTGLFFSNSPTEYAISTWDATHTILLGDKDSGLYYMHYVALSTAVEANTLSGLDDKRVKAYGTIPFYYLSSTDAALLGHYTHTTEAGCKAGGANDIPSTASFTIVVSDNPLVGNMMVSEFDGMTCTNKVPGIYTHDTNTATWDNYSIPFDLTSPNKRFARASGMDTKLNFVFTRGTPNTFYADANFGYVIGDSHPWTWPYYYVAGNQHVYTQQLP